MGEPDSGRCWVSKDEEFYANYEFGIANIDSKSNKKP